jgi:DNA-binding transcriptional MerR regulator
MPTTSRTRSYTARDVQDMAGLSYRQLNVWAARGVLPGDDKRGTGWRRFSGRELFMLMVCVEIRRQFGVPVGRLRRVRDLMLRQDTDHLDAAARLIAKNRSSVWLVTDLDDTFALKPESDIPAFVSDSLREGDTPQGFLWIKVSPLVKRLVTRLEQDEIPSSLRRALAEPEDASTPCSPQEAEVLRLIRSNDYSSIQVVMRGGQIKTILTERPVAQLKAEDVERLLRDHAYQTVTLTTKAGRLVSATQSIPRKLND